MIFGAEGCLQNKRKFDKSELELHGPECTRVPSHSSDEVVSGEVWVDLNSISDSESESESCGKVLLCVSEGFGFWSARLTTKAWVGSYIYTPIPPQQQRSCC